MYKLEKRIVTLIEKHVEWIAFIFITLIALLVRLKGIDFISNDYNTFLLPWYSELQTKGGLKGLGCPIGDYYIPYLSILALLTYLPVDPLYSIKWVSIISEFLCALCAARLAQTLLAGRKGAKYLVPAIYAIVILSPIVILDGAIWGQCDYIYILFILLSFLSMNKRKYNPAFFFLGIAFIFKLQTVFILPLYILHYVANKEFSITKFLYLPLLYLLGGLPAIMGGREIGDVYGIYFRQASTYQSLSLNVPNIWRIFPREEHYSTYALLGIGAVMVILVLIAIYFIDKGYRLNFQLFFLFGVVIEGICVMILPGMHERYVVVLCLLSSVYFLLYDMKHIWIGLIFNYTTLTTYMHYLHNIEVKEYYIVFGMINIAALIYLILYAFHVLKKELPVNTGS